MNEFAAARYIKHIPPVHKICTYKVTLAHYGTLGLEIPESYQKYTPQGGTCAAAPVSGIRSAAAKSCIHLEALRVVQ